IDFLRAGLRAIETVFDLRGKTRQQRFERLAPAGKFADERLEAALPVVEREVERLLLRLEVMRRHGKRIGVFAKLRRERARVGLRRRTEASKRCDLGGDAAEGALKFLDSRGKAALDGGKLLTGRGDRLVDDGAGLAQVVDHLRQLVAQTVACAGERADGSLGAERNRIAQRRP